MALGVFSYTHCQLIFSPSNGYAVVRRIAIIYRIDLAHMCEAAFDDKTQLICFVVGDAALAAETEMDGYSCRVFDE